MNIVPDSLKMEYHLDKVKDFLNFVDHTPLLHPLHVIRLVTKAIKARSWANVTKVLTNPV